MKKVNNKEDRFIYIELYDIYGPLLTKREQEYFEAHFHEDLSLQEMAELFCVSKSRCGASINDTKNKLITYEKLLNFHSKIQKYQKLLADKKIKISEELDV